MARGGARFRSGPAPDPNALRRDRDEGEWVTLPASGGVSEVPTWPLTDASDREAELWQRLWTEKPQALMWERLGLHIDVALYVRRLSEAEEPGSRVTLSTLVRQLADALGLTVPGMRANRWRIGGADVSPGDPGTMEHRSSRRASAMWRQLKVVSSDDGT